MPEQYDAIIIGGGIAGSGLGAVLAKAGKSVLILEKTTAYRDMVRGEWIAPWGVAEAKRTGLYDVLCKANDYHIPTHTEFGDGIDPVEAQGRVFPLALLPGIPGPLAIGHPQACQVLLDAAAEAGATVIRGIGDVTIETEGTPSVCWETDGIETVATCRLIVGADGRGSNVRRQAGIELHQDPTHHFFAGMLVEGADEWPTELETMGTEGDVQFFVFPQAPGKARLYLSYPVAHKTRFAGERNEEKFLEAFRLKTLPHSDSLANARIAGPCHSIPNQSAWTDRPMCPGLVLLGDAAGYNDPIIGQGLSIAMRDIRVVGELLLGSETWDEPLLEPYVEERTERMRRLRMAANMDSIIHAEFGREATARKIRLMSATQTDPTLGMARMAVMVGPELLPPDAFTDEALERVRQA